MPQVITVIMWALTGWLLRDGWRGGRKITKIIKYSLHCFSYQIYIHFLNWVEVCVFNHPCLVLPGDGVESSCGNWHNWGCHWSIALMGNYCPWDILRPYTLGHHQTTGHLQILCHSSPLEDGRRRPFLKHWPLCALSPEKKYTVLYMCISCPTIPLLRCLTWAWVVSWLTCVCHVIFFL